MVFYVTTRVRFLIILPECLVHIQISPLIPQKSFVAFFFPQMKIKYRFIVYIWLLCLSLSLSLSFFFFLEGTRLGGIFISLLFDDRERPVFIFLKFYWRIVDFQGGDNFCCTTKWYLYNNYTYIYILFQVFPHICYHRILGRVLSF